MIPASLRARRRAILRACGPVLWLILLPVLLHAPFWLAGLRESPIWTWSGLMLRGHGSMLPGLPGYLDPNAGWTTQALGGLAAQQWLAGSVPWWDPFSGIGLPLAAEMQGSSLFLPYVLMLALPGGVVWLGLAIQWTAGLTTWRLLRRLGLGVSASITGALLFELGACFAWMGPPANLPCAFLPLFLLGIEGARERWGGMRPIALAVALSLYAGFPETAYLNGLLALVWAGLRGVQGPNRVLFAVRVAAGGVVGLLLAAPLLWPFLDGLRTAELGARDGIGMAALSWPPSAAVQVLAPYALGLPAGLSAGTDPGSTLFWLWGRAGGYLGTGLAMAALAGGLAPGRERVLRWLLLAWAGLLLARCLGVPHLGEWFRAVPFQNQLQVWRYAGASWLLPCCILAAYATEARVGRWSGLAAFVIMSLTVFSLTLAWPLVREVPRALPYGVASGGGAVLFAAIAGVALWRGRGLAAVLVAEAATLAVIPLFGGTVRPALDWPAIRFLQSHTALSRITTLGPFAPNYPALFGIASVNYSYLPLPALWSRHVMTALEPGIEPVLFNGMFPPDAPGRPSHAQILVEHQAAYEALAVQYVLVAAGQNPFRSAEIPPAGPPTAYALEPGATLSGALPAMPGPVTAVLVTIGTYAGAATGPLEIELCDATFCSTGRRMLEDAADNQPFAIPLAPRSLQGPLTWTLRHPSGRPVAIWRWPTAQGLEAQITLQSHPVPEPVYADRIISVFELPNPAPYFSAEGCRLQPVSRTVLEAACDRPATLIRRELSMPGWRARVGAAEMDTGTVAQLFQSAPLPAGNSHVVFSYRPPGTPYFMALFATGVLGLFPWWRVLAGRRDPPL